MTVHSFSTKYNTEQFSESRLLPPDSHHSSDVVYQREGGDNTCKMNEPLIYEGRPINKLKNGIILLIFKI